jgi:hypothetical protein
VRAILGETGFSLAPNTVADFECFMKAAMKMLTNALSSEQASICHGEAQQIVLEPACSCGSMTSGNCPALTYSGYVVTSERCKLGASSIILFEKYLIFGGIIKFSEIRRSCTFQKIVE